MNDATESLRLDYRLTEADVLRYGSAGLLGKCWRSCRGRKPALLLLVALACFLVGTCFRSRGARSGGLALGTTLTVLAALAWGREARHVGRVRRLAGQMGLPRDLQLIVSPEGIAEASGPGSDVPSRTFAWSEVVDVIRVDHLTAIRLRPAGGILIVPDSAFATPERRAEFVARVRRGRDSASHAFLT